MGYYLSAIEAAMLLLLQFCKQLLRYLCVIFGKMAKN